MQKLIKTKLLTPILEKHNLSTLMAKVDVPEGPAFLTVHPLEKENS